MLSNAMFEPQLRSKDVFRYEIVWAFSFDSSFSIPEESKGPPHSIYVGCFMVLSALYVKKTPQKGLNETKASRFYYTAEN